MSRETVTAVVIGAYLVGITVVGLIYAKRASKSSVEYWVAGRSMGTVVTSLALYSALFSGAAYVGVPGLLYARGFTYFAAFGAGVTASLLPAMVLFARPLARSRCITLPMFLSRRFPGRSMAIATPLLLLIASAPYAIVQLRGGGELMQATINVPVTWGVILTGVIVALYVTVGGMWASIMTDLVQAIMMIGGFAVLAVAVLVTVGAPGDLFAAAQTATSGAFATISDSPIAYFGIFSTWVLGVAATPWALVRFLTTVGERQARHAMVGTATLFCLFWFLWTPVIGMGALALAPNLDNPNNAVFAVIGATLGPILGGVIVAAVLAAIMSTLDSVLLICGSCIAEDLVRGVLRPDITERALLKVSAAAVAVTGLGVVIIAIYSTGLIALMGAAAIGGLAAGFLAPLAFGIYWSRANTAGALSGMLVGITLYAVLFFANVMPEFTETFVSVCVSALTVALVSLATTAPKSVEQMEFTETRRAV